MYFRLRDLLNDSPSFSALPTKKEEKWKFSPLASYLERNYKKVSPYSETCELRPQEKYWLLFGNGRLLAHRLPASVHIRQHPAAFEERYNPFVSLAACTAPSPIELSCFEDVDFSVYFTYAQQSFAASSLNIILKESVKARVYFNYEGGEESFITHASHIKLDAYARMHLVQSQKLSAGAVFISQNTLHLHENAYLNSFALLYGGEYLHNFIQADLHYQSEANITALLLSREIQKEIFSCDIEHLADRSHSHLLSKQIIKDKSVCVFDAKSCIHNATKATRAKQASHALLLGKEAQIHSKPHLEIYSDDLSASHGSTVGELDRNAISYLLSRGITEAKARKILIAAFVNEAVESIEQVTDKEQIYALIGEYLETL